MSSLIYQDFRTWLFRDALPFWAEHGPDHTYGGYVEALSFTGADAACTFKRTRVTCRQIYSFAHAKRLGWTGDADRLIAHGVAYLRDKALLADNSGYAKRLTREGDILDPTLDLYDHAFALFAFAWAYHATGDTAYRDFAADTLDKIEAAFRRPDSPGFLHMVPAQGYRLQNPHMHLLEAALIAWEATGDERYKAQAQELAGLFKSHFFNRRTGTLAEYFADDWSIAPGDQGRIAEPGHQYEWAWILETCQRKLGIDVADEIRTLIATSEREGINPGTGLVMNRVRDDGTPIDAGSRSWTNTERLKAANALFRLDGVDPTPIIEETGGLILSHHLSAEGGIDIPRGTWIDHFDAEGRPISEDIPASILYHILLAFADAMEAGDQLENRN